MDFTEADVTQVCDALDHLSWIFADKPMLPERKTAYWQTLNSDPDLETIEQLCTAIATTCRIWTGPHIPWPADILDNMARRHSLVL